MNRVQSEGEGVHSPEARLIPTEQAETSVLDWKEAADGLCAEMLKQAPTQVRKVADQLYELLLTDVEAFLRENVDYNLSADLSRAKRTAETAHTSLRLVATALDVEVKGFPNYPTPGMVADRCIEKVEQITATINAMNEALTEATTASSVGTQSEGRSETQ